MLRMVLAGLLIPLGVGVLAAMELKTPPRTAIAVAQPLAETTIGMSDSSGALAKADRLEVTYASTEAPTAPAPIDERISSPPDAAAIGTPAVPKIVERQRHDLATRKVATTALAKSKPKTTESRRVAVADRSKSAGTQPCRLSAFGGLRKALNLSGCEI
jgi:hypothetical protein